MAMREGDNTTQRPLLMTTERLDNLQHLVDALDYIDSDWAEDRLLAWLRPRTRLWEVTEVCVPLPVAVGENSTHILGDTTTPTCPTCGHHKQ